MGWGFQQMAAGASDVGGALADGHILLALNTWEGKISSMTRVLAPQTGQFCFAVGCPMTTIPEPGDWCCGGGANMSCAAVSLVFRFRTANNPKWRIL